MNNERIILLLEEELGELATIENKIAYSKEKKAQKGKIVIANSHGKYNQYYLVDAITQKKRYIKKNENAMVKEIVQAQFDLKLEKTVIKKKELISNFLKSYRRLDLDMLWNQLSVARRKLVTPAYSVREDYIDKWEKRLEGGKNTYPIEHGYMTIKGEMVRSKSEKILADLFYSKGIKYVYEAELILGKKKIYPDFALLDERNMRTIYYEHFGMVDDPIYAENMVNKIELYYQNGYTFGNGLLYSFETSSHFNQKYIEKILDDFLKNDNILQG